MAIFYTDTASLAVLQVSGSATISGSTTALTVIGSGSNVFTISGSTGGLFQVAEATGGADIFLLASGSVNVMKIDAYKNVYISGSLTVTGSIIADSIAATASYAVSASWADQSEIQVVAGGSTNSNVSQLVFSNANGITFGLDNGTITAAAAAAGGQIKSFYQNVVVLNGSNTFAGGGSSNIVQPFILPYDISIGYVRAPVTMAYGQTSYATTANTSVFLNQAFTWYANLYSQGSGGSSRSILQFAQASATMRYQVTGSIGAASGNQTIVQRFTVPIETGTTSFSATVSSNLSNQSVVSTNLTAFSAARYIDIAFNSSLAAGNYFIAFQKSSAITTNLGAMSNLTANSPYLVATQINTVINIFGNSTAASNGFGLFNGVWTTNVNGQTTSAIDQTAISSAASQPLVPFQLIRQV